MTYKLRHQPLVSFKDDKTTYKQLEQECKDRADCEKSLTNWNIEAGDKVEKLEKENAELRGKYINLVNNSAGDIREIRAQKKQLTELAEAAENMLELLANNAPIDGLWLSNMEEWDELIKGIVK